MRDQGARKQVRRVQGAGKPAEVLTGEPGNRVRGQGARKQVRVQGAGKPAEDQGARKPARCCGARKPARARSQGARKLEPENWNQQ